MGLENEIWKDINGYEGLYQVSNLGRVKSLERRWKSGRHSNYSHFHEEKIMSNAIDKSSGYIRISLFKDSKGKSFNTHTLVANAFIPNPENKPTVNHKNSVRHDNRVDNLEWATFSENNLHAVDVGHNNTRGEGNAFAKLTEDSVRKIREMYETGEYEQRPLAKLFSINQATLWRVIHRKSWKHIV